MANKIIYAALSTAIMLGNATEAFSCEAHAKATQNTDNNTGFYIAAAAGGSFPLSDEIKFKNEHGEKMTFSLKSSAMYNGRIGYIFAPDMAIEASFIHQPSFKIGFKALPQTFKNIETLTRMPLIRGNTRARVNIYSFNFVYDLMEVYGVRPYVLAGAGVANVTIRPTALSLPVPFGGVGLFYVKKSKGNYFTWQAGVGATKEIANGLFLDGSAKLQVVNNIKVRYSTFDPRKQESSHSYEKKTLGGIELGVGLKYKF